MKLFNPSFSSSCCFFPLISTDKPFTHGWSLSKKKRERKKLYQNSSSLDCLDFSFRSMMAEFKVNELIEKLNKNQSAIHSPWLCEISRHKHNHSYCPKHCMSALVSPSAFNKTEWEGVDEKIFQVKSIIKILLPPPSLEWPIGIPLDHLASYGFPNLPLCRKE